MARRGLKLKVTGKGQVAVGLTSILNQGQFFSLKNKTSKYVYSAFFLKDALNKHWLQMPCCTLKTGYRAAKRYAPPTAVRWTYQLCSHLANASGAAPATALLPFR